MGFGLSLDGLHVILWQRAGPASAVRVQITRQCAEFGVSRATLGKALHAMEEQGRLRCLTRPGGAAVKTYEVIDPALWNQDHQSPR